MSCATLIVLSWKITSRRVGLVGVAVQPAGAARVTRAAIAGMKPELVAVVVTVAVVPGGASGVAPG